MKMETFTDTCQEVVGYCGGWYLAEKRLLSTVMGSIYLWKGRSVVKAVLFTCQEVTGQCGGQYLQVNMFLSIMVGFTFNVTVEQCDA